MEKKSLHQIENYSHEIKQEAVAKLVPYKNNARKHPEKQIKELIDSIKEVGFTSPIVIDNENVIIVGHGRVEAAKRLNMETIPVVVLDKRVTSTKKKAYTLADNKIPLNAEWEDFILAAELLDLHEEGYDLGKIGFSEKEIQNITGSVPDVSIDEFTEVVETNLSNKCPKCGFEFD